jgi:hypothetical protein
MAIDLPARDFHDVSRASIAAPKSAAAQRSAISFNAAIAPSKDVASDTAHGRNPSFAQDGDTSQKKREPVAQPSATARKSAMQDVVRRSARAYVCRCGM